MTSPTTASARTTDRVRQVTVLVGSAAAIAGAAWGSGAFGGTPIEDAANGALAADATLLAPASAAFSIWSAIYVGLAVFAVVQALPSRATDPRMRAVAWLILASMILNAAWIATVQAGWLPLSVVTIGLLVAVLVVTAKRLASRPATRTLDRVVTDGTVGLYLGWTTVATAANVAAWLSAWRGADADDGAILAIAALVVVGAAAVVLARLTRGSFVASAATGIAMAWGLAWIAYGRAEGDPESLAVMWAAGLAACVAFAAPFAIRDFTRGRTSHA